MTTVRETTASDRPQIRALMDQGIETNVRQGNKSLVACDGAGDVVGFALVSFINYGTGGYGAIEELRVAENVRDQGIGRQLLEACCAWLSENGLTLALVSTNPQAQRFYQREGFTDCTGPWMWKTITPRG